MASLDHPVNLIRYQNENERTRRAGLRLAPKVQTRLLH